MWAAPVDSAFHPADSGLAMTPEEMLARLLYRDGLMLVIDKPAGLPVHRGPKGGESLEDHFDALRFGLPRAPALAHRLDKDTSGCLVLGRHRKALAAARQAVQARQDRQDLLGRGRRRPADGRGPHRHAARQAGRDARLVDEARPAWAAGDDDLEGDGPRSRRADTWLALEPLTGRTHQLRVHCAEMGWPILGDNIYGSAPRIGGPPLHLHAREIVVPISKNKPPVTSPRRCRRICASC